MILGGENTAGRVILGIVILLVIFGLIALVMYFKSDESTPTSPTGSTQSNDGVDALKKYTRVANRYALALNPDYGKDSSVSHRSKYYPESKEWQAVKPTYEGLLFDNPGLCAVECDKYPKCKSFYWDSQQSPGVCYLGTGFDPNTSDIGETSTTYYKS
jgi:hypothetical protein